MKIKYTTAIYKGKYLYGIDNWGGCGLVERNVIQRQQDKIVKIVLSPKHHNKTNHERLKIIDWYSIEKQIEYNTYI